MAVPRTQFYHPARVIDTALHGIDRAIRRAEGIALVVGPPGTGKSLLLAKVAESVAEDFRVALLSGATICTRRALWQSILAELGQPFRGIDEAELRIAVGELVRGLAASGSGLVILVDEAHTLPLRLIEELRLLAIKTTPLPAVHLVLAGPPALEERLGDPKMESFSQRIAVRAYLEPLDHAETVAYLRTQTRAAGLDWGQCFEPGCEDAVYTTADGVPRLMNQICDQALVLVAGAGRRVKAADIAAAWQEIQRLPSPALFGHIVEGETRHDAATVGPAEGRDHESQREHEENRARWSDTDFPEDDSLAAHGGDGGVGVIEFGPLEDRPSGVGMRPLADIGELVGMMDEEQPSGGRGDPWHGPDVEFVFDASADPFQEFFEQEERIVERYLVRSDDDFSRHLHVSSGEGAALVRQLAEIEDRRDASVGHAGGQPPVDRDAASVEASETDDDMVVIEEDLLAATGVRPTVAAVRLGDYRRLFARLRRGG
ncbi:MAG: ExeA family protein [Planctomycetia bacterium]